MVPLFHHKFPFKAVCSLLTAVVFLLTPILAEAQALRDLPLPGTLVVTGGVYTPALVKGLRIDPQQPRKLLFMLDKGQTPEADLRENVARQARYFLTGLAVPEKEFWVNLSPYESDRIVTKTLGMTELGRDLLAQDYILKQFTASLLHPDSASGRVFWARLRAVSDRDVNVGALTDDFHKVWIVPARARVVEKGLSGVVVEARLKVMLEQDYLARAQAEGSHALNAGQEAVVQVMREVIVPVIEREVNEGARFARLRQIFQALILAKWYRQKKGAAPWRRSYLDKARLAGVAIADKAEPRKIYDTYVDAYKKGAVNLIREEKDAVSGELLPRKYFSGGVNDFGMLTPGVFSVVSGPLPAVPDVAVVDLAAEVAPVKLTHAPVIYLWHAGPTKRFDKITDEYLQGLADKGINELWTMGIWERSKFSRYYQGWAAKIFGQKQRLASAYSLDDYTVAASLGGEAAFKRLVERAAKYGIKVCVDLVTNHAGVMGKLMEEHPELFIRVEEGRIPEAEIANLSSYFRGIRKNLQESEFVRFFFWHKDKNGKSWIYAHQKDPYYAAWLDTVAFDFSKPETQVYIEALIDRIMRLTNGGGIRFDMFHLALAGRFNNSWGELKYGDMNDDFWRNLFREMKKKYPDSVFIAEMYENEEYALKLGIDFVYAKHLSLEHFVSLRRSSRMFGSLLSEGADFYMQGIIKFLENHDDIRGKRTIDEIRETTAFSWQAVTEAAPLRGGIIVRSLIEQGYVRENDQDLYLNADIPEIEAVLHKDFSDDPDEINALLSERVLKSFIARAKAANAALMAYFSGGTLINEGFETGRHAETNGKPDALNQPDAEDTWLEYPELTSFYKNLFSLMADKLWCNGTMRPALVGDQRDLPEGVLVDQRRIQNEDGSYEVGLVVVNHSGTEKTIPYINQHFQWDYLTEDEKDQMEFSDILHPEAPPVSFRDMVKERTWTLQPWEYHVYRLQKKDAKGLADQKKYGGIDASGMEVAVDRSQAASDEKVVGNEDFLLPSFAGFKPVLLTITPASSDPR